MTRPTSPPPASAGPAAAPQRPGPAHRRRWLVWLLAGLAAALVTLLAGVGVTHPAPASAQPALAPAAAPVANRAAPPAPAIGPAEPLTTTPGPPPPTATPLPALPPVTPLAGDQPPEIQLPSVPPVVTPPASVPPAQPPPIYQDPTPAPPWWDIPDNVNRSINELLGNAVYGALSGMLDLIIHTLLALPDLTQNPQIHQLITLTRWIANTVFVLLIVIGGFVITSYETLQTRYTLREYLPKVIGGFLAVNAAPSVISLGIQATNDLIAGLLGQQSVDGVVVNVRSIILGQTQGAGLFLLMLLWNVLVIMVLLFIVYIYRLIITILVIIAGPLALVCHALPYAEGIAVMWWRALIGVLAIPFLQAIVFLVYIQVFFAQNAQDQDNNRIFGVSGTIVNLLLSTVLLFILLKIPGWVLRAVGLRRGGRSILAGLVMYTVIRGGMRGMGWALRRGGRLIAGYPGAMWRAGRWLGRNTSLEWPQRWDPGEGGGFARQPVRPTPLPPTLTGAGANPIPREPQVVTLSRTRLDRAEADHTAVLVRHARDQAARHWSPPTRTAIPPAGAAPATGRPGVIDGGALPPATSTTASANTPGGTPSPAQSTRPGEQMPRPAITPTAPAASSKPTAPSPVASPGPAAPSSPVVSPAPATHTPHPRSADRPAPATPPQQGSENPPPLRTAPTTTTPPTTAKATAGGNGAPSTPQPASERPVEQAVTRHRVRRRRRRAGIDTYEVTPQFHAPPETGTRDLGHPQATRPATPAGRRRPGNSRTHRGTGRGGTNPTRTRTRHGKG
jgi:hypothetical protein